MSSKFEKIQAVKGMNDILPPVSARWEWLEDKVRSLMARHAYLNARTPIVEPTALFVRGIGEATDIVEKEMYSFEDRLNGEQLTLRPENTASLVRAATEHSLLYDGGKRVDVTVTGSLETTSGTMLREAAVLVDGQKVGVVGNGKSIELSITPGQHASLKVKYSPSTGTSWASHTHPRQSRSWLRRMSARMRASSSSPSKGLVR